MNLREQVGQLLVMGLDGYELGPVQSAWLRMLRPGGIVLFTRNINDARQTHALLEAIQQATSTPMLRCVDLEGGSVDRLREALAPMPSAGEVAALKSPRASHLHGQLIGRAARAFGFTTVFAPVLDLARPVSAKVMGTRAAAPDAKGVIAYAKPFLRALAANGILGCGKHFPGLGDGEVDSHHKLPRIRRSWKKMWSEDLAPYRSLRLALPMVMISHAAFPAVTGNSDPASLSPFWIQKTLRQKIGYDGIVISDDLEMKAVLARSIETAAIESIEAGGDIYLICHEAALITRAYEAVLAEAEHSTAFRRKVTLAAQRVMVAKKKWARRLRFAAVPAASEIEALRREIHQLSKLCAKG
jgi:beta-N-acetylhexosaminidase